METITTSTLPVGMPSGKFSFPVVGIGASAGGLEAFTEVLRFLPHTTGMAYVFVQHLDPTHDSILPSLLAHASAMDVCEAQDAQVVEADHLYVIPPNTDMTLEQGVLKLLPRTATRGQHLSIDRFFRSLADDQKGQAIGVILSGTASDGTIGLQAIKAEGGITFAQEATSARYPGMPQSAIAAGCVDFTLPPEEIARELVRISLHLSAQQVLAAESNQGTYGQKQLEREQVFQKILRVLRRSMNVDFSVYKPTTMQRRILRRMLVQQMDSMGDYLAYLQDHQAEVEALYQDLLINVTDFFRDPSTFHALTHDVFPRLVEGRSPGEPIRVWVPGCSTGEEVYSLAICFLEFLSEQSRTFSIQIFGTDLNGALIEQARAGLYPPGATRNLSPERLQRFFLHINGNYQISKSLRDLCVFAQHNIFQDPPFSRLDLLSCQNVLIYLGPGIQKKMMQTFHYALKPQGFLLLGPSETVGSSTDLFAPLGKKQNVYVKKIATARPSFVGGVRRAQSEIHDSIVEGQRTHQEDLSRGFDVQKEADHLLLARYAPASVVIDTEMEILQFRGHTGPYLEPASGKASLNLLKMAREGLGLELRTAIHKARKSGHSVKKEGVQMTFQGSERLVSIEVLPLQSSATEHSFLILFEDAPAPVQQPASLAVAGERQTDAQRRGVKDRRIKRLELELAATREEMQAIIEEMEAAHEELQSANEETLSSNEELQSLNEELETSKEEIESSNEELVVVNQELQQRNTQLQAANAYAEAIVATVREPLLVLNVDLRVHTANRSFYQFFQTVPEETEHHFVYDLGNGQWNAPALRTLLGELLSTNHSFTDYEVEHDFPRIGHKTMLLNARRLEISGPQAPHLLLAMEDITQRKQAEEDKRQLLEQREEFLRIASHELRTPLTSVKAYTQLLHRRFTKAGDEQAATLLAKMETQLNKLITLISELLDTTRMEAGRLPWHAEEFDFETLVREIVEEVERTTERHHISIKGAVSTPLRGDRERIGQVLTNLLTNAMKYSPQATSVVVTLTANEDAITVGVQDFGIGIALEQQAHLFERFYRVGDSAHATFPGLGLGLYISAEIVKRQGGQMWVESQDGTGSTFFFTAPFAQTPD